MQKFVICSTIFSWPRLPIDLKVCQFMYKMVDYIQCLHCQILVLLINIYSVIRWFCGHYVLCKKNQRKKHLLLTCDNPRRVGSLKMFPHFPGMVHEYWPFLLWAQLGSEETEWTDVHSKPCHVTVENQKWTLKLYYIYCTLLHKSKTFTLLSEWCYSFALLRVKVNLCHCIWTNFTLNRVNKVSYFYADNVMRRF